MAISSCQELPSLFNENIYLMRLLGRNVSGEPFEVTRNNLRLKWMLTHTGIRAFQSGSLLNDDTVFQRSPDMKIQVTSWHRQYSGTPDWPKTIPLHFKISEIIKCTDAFKHISKNHDYSWPSHLHSKLKIMYLHTGQFKSHLIYYQGVYWTQIVSNISTRKI